MKLDDYKDLENSFECLELIYRIGKQILEIQEFETLTYEELNEILIYRCFYSLYMTVANKSPLVMCKQTVFDDTERPEDLSFDIRIYMRVYTVLNKYFKEYKEKNGEKVPPEVLNYIAK